jgi:hypothetical protein
MRISVAPKEIKDKRGVRGRSLVVDRAGGHRELTQMLLFELHAERFRDEMRNGDDYRSLRRNSRAV